MPFGLQSEVGDFQDHRLGRGAGQGRRLHERGKDRRVEEDAVVVNPL